MPKQNELPGRYGALKSWGNTTDRAARTAPARASSPASLDYWLARLDPVRFATATDDQKHAAADAARRAHFVHLSMLAAQAKRAS
ncbi:MAG: hypothetical protein ABMA25_02280 [Ilumatobacteraceae bacterium]